MAKLDERLASRLKARFAKRVMDQVKLPATRADDLCEACELRQETPRLHLTCTITESSYQREWDGSEAPAFALVDEAADDAASLIARTPHYAWMRSRR